MASETPANSLFAEAQVAAKVTTEDSPKFFDEHGFFYQADEDIGRLVEAVDDKGLENGPAGLQSFRPALLRIEVG